jgi:hypothetical protein
MISTDKVTEIFCLIDEFSIEFEYFLQKSLIGVKSKRPSTMSSSEIMTIIVLFHTGCFRNFKHFYIGYVQKHMKDEFPNTVSYNRFTELMQSNLLPLTMFLKTCCLGNCTGISFIDSTPVRVCKNKRINQNKVFKGIANIGKSTMGWFYGFKLHLIINDMGEILNFTLTQANTDDRAPLKNQSFIKKLFGKLYADKGYIGKELMLNLFNDGIHLITHIKNNMKNSLMTMKDKILLRKRSVIETVNDELKNMCQIEHSRHRSVGNFLTNLISGLIAYCFFPKKPSIKFKTQKTNQLILF